MDNELEVISVYDCDRKELIAIFKTRILLSKYLSKGNTTRTFQSISSCLFKKGKFLKKSNSLNLNLAFRFSNENQKELIKNENYLLIRNGLPDVTFNMLISFNSTAESLFNDAKFKGLHKNGLNSSSKGVRKFRFPELLRIGKDI